MRKKTLNLEFHFHRFLSYLAIDNCRHCFFCQVKYFHTPEERYPHLLEFSNGRAYTSQGDLFDTTDITAAHSGEGFAIFVIGEDNNFYGNEHIGIGVHHSSEFAGHDIVGAGEISAKNGEIVSISNKSGHYRPGSDNMLVSLALLRDKIGSLDGIVALVQHPDGVAVKYSAREFLETRGRCLPLLSDSYNLIETAIILDLHEFAESLLTAGNAQDESLTSSFLHTAARTGRSFWIQKLLDHGFSPMQRDAFDKTPLEIAARGRDIPSITSLYAATPDSQVRQQAFLETIRSGSMDAFNFFQERGYTLATVDEYGNTPYHFAAMAPTSHILELFLTTFDSDLALLPNKNGDTPLHLAAASDCVKNITILQELGLDLSSTNALGETALHIAAGSSKESVSQHFIKHASPDLFLIRNNKGATPVHYAAAHAPAHVFKEYLAYTKDVDIADYAGETLLFYTLKSHGSWTNFCHLIERGASLSTRNAAGFTFFHQAVLMDNWVFVVALTYHDGLLETTPEGNTPLHIAVLNKNSSLFTFLCNYCQPEVFFIENAEGKNILDLAIQSGQKDIVDIINSKLAEFKPKFG